MATKAKKSSAAKNPVPETAPTGGTLKKDTKELNREISNALFTDEERAALFFAKHWKKVVALALLAVVAVTAVFAVVRHREEAKQAATAKLAQAKSIDELKAELAKNPHVPGVDAARFRLAKLYADKGEYDKARQELKTVATSSEDTVARCTAQSGIAYMLEIEGKKAEAAQEFHIIAGNVKLPVAVRAEAAYAAERLYIDLKKPDLAKEALKTIRSLNIDAQQESAAAYWRMQAEALGTKLN